LRFENRTKLDFLPRLQDLLQYDGNKDGVFTNSPLNSQNRFFDENLLETEPKLIDISPMQISIRNDDFEPNLSRNF
jgi:hypothetical protein